MFSWRCISRWKALALQSETCPNGVCSSSGCGVREAVLALLGECWESRGGFLPTPQRNLWHSSGGFVPPPRALMPRVPPRWAAPRDPSWAERCRMACRSVPGRGSPARQGLAVPSLALPRAKPRLWLALAQRFPPPKHAQPGCFQPPRNPLERWLKGTRAERAASAPGRGVRSYPAVLPADAAAEVVVQKNTFFQRAGYLHVTCPASREPRPDTLRGLGLARSGRASSSPPAPGSAGLAAHQEERFSK